MLIFKLKVGISGTDSDVYAFFSENKEQIKNSRHKLYLKRLKFQTLTRVTPYKNGFILILVIRQKTLKNNSLQSTLKRKKSYKHNLLILQQIGLRSSK